MGMTKSVDKDPQSTVSFGYAMSINSNPGGNTFTAEVTPGEKRITGSNDNARAQRDSISRQYTDVRKAVSAA
ncbi:MAG: hypothetical protein M3N98_15075 [Actinomycetota bacterium]|nr:hypothetical protein [Actinomycetota bacterium]